MKLIRGLHNLPLQHEACVATIGNFDGLHRGHQAVLQQLVDWAEEKGVASTVVIFEPQPVEFFKGNNAVARLTRLREKLPLFKAAGIDHVLCLNFNAHLASLSADDFVKSILLEGLNVQGLVLGEDFRFGSGRTGDLAFLRQKGLEVAAIETVCDEASRISSTQIRAALEHGNLVLAENLLGRPYSMQGRVAHGDKRGRMIGFPTANIYLHRKISAVKGVYAVKVKGLRDDVLYGVANVGNRPTVDGTRSLLEVHLFDFDEVIYGRYIEVVFAHKLRDEKRYDSFDLLKEQIFKDAHEAREFFKKVSNHV